MIMKDLTGNALRHLFGPYYYYCYYYSYIYIYVISKKTFGGRKRLGENGLNGEETTQSIRNGLTALCSDQWWFMFFRSMEHLPATFQDFVDLFWAEIQKQQKRLVLIFG